MAGSQLKQLKAALKEKGLTGQANVKKSKKTARTSAEIKRDEKQKILSNIREQFNKFDTKVNRTKHDYTEIKGGKFVKGGVSQANNAGKTKSMVNEMLENKYKFGKSRHGKTGGVIDRRFGESNKHMTTEEKLLARFTKERERESKKNVFSLDDDEDGDLDGDDGFVLTHYGKSLALEDDNDADNKRNYDSLEEMSLMPNGGELEAGQPARKKSKAEVMKEIMAKSKFYKHQRQQEHQKTQNEIMDLDDNFVDVITDLNSTAAVTKKDQSKTQDQIEYDQKVRELIFDRRSAPADRSKTAEELEKEHEEKKKKLEEARLNRMNGMDERNAVGDDLDDDFWNENESEEGEEMTSGSVSGDEQEIDKEEEDDDDEEEVTTGGRPKPKPVVSIAMPTTHSEFLEHITSIPNDKQGSYVDKILQTYHPRLLQGNKAKIGTFTGILVDHVLYLSEQKDVDPKLIEVYVKKIKSLGENYNEPLVERIRAIIEEKESKFINDNDNSEDEIKISDLMFYALIGFLFSTSDHHHLVVTPALLLMNKEITSIQYCDNLSFSKLFSTIFIVDVLNKYTGFAKRIIPEIVNGLEKILLTLIPEPSKIQGKNKLNCPVVETIYNISKSYKSNQELGLIKLSMMNKQNVTDDDKFILLKKVLNILDEYLSIWKDTKAFPEIISPFIVILKHLVKYYNTQIPELANLLNKMVKLNKNACDDRKPLTLQYHRALAIPTFAPKFEENFNPDKKSYDVNRERQEVNKLRNQLKKEKKSTLKDIRKESKFIARESIKEKKASYDAYHKKMASIYNSISTVEGAEKNSYDREKKERKKRR